MKKTLISFVMVLFLVGSVNGASSCDDCDGDTWQSQLFPWDGNTFRYEEVSGFSLPDFSYAGYHQGEADIPYIPTTVTINPQSGDDTARIQSAINSAQGGALLLTAGTYTVTGYIEIPGNTVLRGEGPDKTFIYVVANERIPYVLVAGRRVGVDQFEYTHSNSGSLLATKDISRGDTEISLSSVSGLDVGDWVVVKNDMSDTLRIEYHGTASYNGITVWPSTGTKSDFKFLRKIVSVNAAERKIVVDTPIPHLLKTRDYAFVKEITGMVGETGIEDLAIGYKIPSSSTVSDYARAIVFYNSYNSWIRNVKSYDPTPSSDGNYHLHSYGIMILSSRWVTIESCDMGYPHNVGGGGNGYLYGITGWDNLIKDSIGRSGRHNIVLAGGGTSGNVFTGFKSHYQGHEDDSHLFLASMNLIDNYEGYCDSACYSDSVVGYFDYDGFVVRNRQDTSGGAGYTAADFVFWNMRLPTDKSLKSDQAHANGGKGYIIGATHIGSPQSTTQYEWREGINDEDRLRPVSLYEAQLQLRLETCSSLGGVDCCTGTETCPGTDFGTASDCSGTCCSESCFTPAPYCGDTYCNGDETCSSCSTDCGSCTTELIIDNGDPGTSYTGTWSVSSGANPYGGESLTIMDSGYTYQWQGSASGTNEVYLWWTYWASRCTSVPVQIYDGSTLLDTVTVSHQENAGQWNLLGTYTFTGTGRVRLPTTSGSCSTCADAVRFLPVALPCTDVDEDGYGSPASPLCTHPEPDCDDSNPDLHQTIICTYDGSQCGSFPLCTESCPAPPSEVCDNSQDDDCDGQQDCQDSDCSAHASCMTCTGLGYHCCDPASCQLGTYPEYDTDCPGTQVCCGECASQQYSYSVFKTSNPPTIDGDISEFSNADEINVLEQDTGTTGTYRLMWDDNALYIAAEFSDTALNTDPTHTDDDELWRDDSLEIMFDTLNDGGDSSPHQDDYKFYAIPSGAYADSQRYDMGWDSGLSHDVSVQGTVNDNGDTDTGWVVEMAIPWPEWGITEPGFGSVWGMNIQLNDLTATGKSSTQWSDSGLSVNIPDGWEDVLFTVRADSTRNGCVSMNELLPFIDSWKYDSTTYPMREMMEAVLLYYNPGVWC